MRFAAAGLLLLIVSGSFSGSAEAGAYDRRQEHWRSSYSPWCLRTTDGGYDCGYASQRQCEISRAGVGGSCDPNPAYVEAPPIYRGVKSKKAGKIN